jgi:hypothetical protein
VGGLTDTSREDVVKSGLLTVDPGIEAFVFVIEDHGDDHLTVFIPGSPNPSQWKRADRAQGSRPHAQRADDRYHLCPPAIEHGLRKSARETQRRNARRSSPIGGLMHKNAR